MSMSHIVASLIALPIASFAWLAFLAEPLTIERTTFAESTYERGEQFIVESSGSKPGWASALCEVRQSSLFLSDSSGLLVQFDQPMNYNDGSISSVKSAKKVPLEFASGEVEGWETATYSCLGVLSKTVFSKVRGSFVIP